jgi:uncharacterized membrane protein
MKKSLKNLAKSYDFKEGYEYYEYIVASYINGQFAQMESLFNKLGKEDRKDFIRWVNDNYENELKLTLLNEVIGFLNK